MVRHIAPAHGSQLAVLPLLRRWPASVRFQQGMDRERTIPIWKWRRRREFAAHAALARVLLMATRLQWLSPAP